MRETGILKILHVQRNLLRLNVNAPQSNMRKFKYQNGNEIYTEVSSVVYFSNVVAHLVVIFSEHFGDKEKNNSKTIRTAKLNTHVSHTYTLNMVNSKTILIIRIMNANLLWVIC